MSYFILEPEVAGSWGDKTTFLAGTRIWDDVEHLHYEFDGWLGDALIECRACFIVTDELANTLKSSELSGYELAPLITSKSETFIEVCGSKILPEFVWLKVSKTAGLDDFGLNEHLELVVSERALELLKVSGIENCDISQIT